LTRSEGLEQVEALREKLRHGILEPELLEKLHNGKRNPFKSIFMGKSLR